MTKFIRFPLVLVIAIWLSACRAIAPTLTPTSLPSPTPQPSATPPPAHSADTSTNPYQYNTTPVMPDSPAQPVMQNAAGFESQFAVADQFLLLLTNVPAAPQGQVYQGWLVADDGARLSVGQLVPAADGTLSVKWVSPTGENLLTRFAGFEMTLEPVDGSDSPTGKVIYAGQMAASQAASARLFFVTNTREPATPLNTPFIPGLLTQLEIAIQHIQNAQNAEAIGAAQEMRVHLEHVINILEGADGPRFKDYNGDGAAQNPGDGFGVKGYARQVAVVLNTPELATPVETGVNALQDQALTIFELTDLTQAAELLTTLYTAATSLRDTTVSELYHQADKMAWFPVLPLP